MAGDTGSSTPFRPQAAFAPKEILLQAKTEVATVLLLNDRFDPQWTVTVDGKPATLLRCNYIMRGVQLDPGVHTVRFNFKIPIGLPLVEVEPDTQVISFVFHLSTALPSYITLSAYILGLALIVVLTLVSRSREQNKGG